MANTYMHGVSAQIGDSIASPTVSPSTVPVYIGTATKADTAIPTNEPLKITSLKTAEDQIGYSDDWKNNTLHQAVYAHFLNTKGSVSPIYVIVMEEATKEAYKSALDAIEKVYPKFIAVPNLVCPTAVFDSENKCLLDKEIVDYAVSKVQKINAHWDAFVYASFVTGATTLDAAITDKKDTLKNPNSERVKSFFPFGRASNGKAIELAVMAMAEQMRVDYDHNSIPMETCSNKTIPIVDTVLCEFSDSPTSIFIDPVRANELNEVGLTTAYQWEGDFIIWGNHTSAYQYGKDNDPRCIFDVNIRMLLYFTNRFQKQWAKSIDKPMTRGLKDTIVASENAHIDGLKSLGAVLYGECTFEEESNPTSDMVNGIFKFDAQVTNTPPAAALDFTIAYTDKGIATYFEE